MTDLVVFGCSGHGSCLLIGDSQLDRTDRADIGHSPRASALSPSVCNLPLIEQDRDQCPEHDTCDAAPTAKDRNQLATHLVAYNGKYHCQLVTEYRKPTLTY